MVAPSERELNSTTALPDVPVMMNDEGNATSGGYTLGLPEREVQPTAALSGGAPSDASLERKRYTVSPVVGIEKVSRRSASVVSATNDAVQRAQRLEPVKNGESWTPSDLQNHLTGLIDKMRRPNLTDVNENQAAVLEEAPSSLAVDANTKEKKLAVAGTPKEEESDESESMHFHLYQRADDESSDEDDDGPDMMEAPPVHVVLPLHSHHHESNDRAASSLSTMPEDGHTYEDDDVHRNNKGVERVTYEGGDCYEGQLSEGHRDGEGTCIYADGSRYHGQWRNDEIHGAGTYTSGGGCYEGEWIFGSQSGHGVFKSSNGGTYAGEWDQGERHGQGVYTYANGDVYEGGWVRGLKSGEGSYQSLSAEGGRMCWLNLFHLFSLEFDPTLTPNSDNGLIRAHISLFDRLL